MSDQDDILKDVKKTFVQWIVGTFGLLLVGSTAFYFNTINRLQDHEKQLTELRILVTRNSTRIDDNVSQSELREFKQMVREDMASIHSDIKEVRDDNKKILEILSEKTR